MNRVLGVSAAALIAGWAAHAAAQDTGEPADDYGASAAESGEIALGEPQTGELETSGDSDWFAVELQSGVEYQFDLEGQPTGQGSLADPLIRLYGPDQAELGADDDGGSGLNSRLRHTPAEDGTYYVAAGAWGSSVGTYTVTVQEYLPPPDDYSAGPDTEGSVEVGGSVEGEIGHEGDEDWFAVELTGGQGYAIDLEGQPTGAGTLGDPYLQLYDSTGEVVDYNDDGGSGFNSRLLVTPDSDGTYYVGAGAFGGATGTYRLSVGEFEVPEDDYAADTGTEGTVAVGGSVSGAIEMPGDGDWFALDLAAGDRVIVDLEGQPTGAGDLPDPYLTVYDSNGNWVASNDDGGTGFNSRLLFEAPAGGTYYVEAAAFGEATGSYTLSVSDAADIPDDYSAGTETGGRVSPGGSVEGELELSGDQDWFAIRLDGGVPYVFLLEGQPTGMGSLPDPYLSLHDADGNMLVWNDDHDGSLNSRIEFTPQQDGIFYLAAAGYADSEGTYTLSAGEADGSGDIRLGEVDPHRMSGDENIAIVVELADGERLTILVPRDYLSEIGSVYIGPQD